MVEQQPTEVEKSNYSLQERTHVSYWSDEDVNSVIRVQACPLSVITKS